ncbi:ANTAR domain-containing protein [Streptomyces sp. HUAS TT20]|uniref:ANTAR domain-containing protein n=1 Tax=Streptomyces sp. HUAS TT20 TaxID=3447509 RepID=UPI0021DAD4E0|nr:ANTAR domain-containing protein [Streptomyces sp. HUAS 15-9]UXY32120.1 ANTAR domain-containing protein [Streptomyces sp. HUAS 15-9]
MRELSLPRQGAREAEIVSRPPVDHPAAAQAAPRNLLIDASPRGGRLLVTIRGDLDISAERAVRAALRDAVGQSRHGVDLDLSGTAFCDACGLNCFLTARRRALEAGKTVTIRAASPPVQRLLSVTGTWPLFTLKRCSAGLSSRSPEASAERQKDVLDDDENLRTEVVQLRRAMQTRPIIDQATGILMATFNLTVQDAWQVLVTISQNTNTKLVHVAEKLLTTVQGQPLPEEDQQYVAAAVAALSTADTTSGPPQPEHPAPEEEAGGRGAPP